MCSHHTADMDTITGVIPSEMGLLSKLELAYIYCMHGLSGSIPSEFGLLAQLIELELCKYSIFNISAEICSWLAHPSYDHTIHFRVKRYRWQWKLGRFDPLRVWIVVQPPSSCVGPQLLSNWLYSHSARPVVDQSTCVGTRTNTVEWHNTYWTGGVEESWLSGSGTNTIERIHS